MKKSIFIICNLLLSFNLLALNSKINGTVEALSIPNSHIVESPYLIRGQAPRNIEDVKDLKKLKVEHVLIFKNQTKNEVDSEKLWLKGEKIQFLHLDFPWKDISDQISVCKMAIKGMKFLSQNIEKESKSFFHCTVGEDRTGFLAGLMKLKLKPKTSIKSLFKNELCAKGYADGNPDKASHVAQLVKDNLTPIFLKMAYIISSKNGEMSESDCELDLDTNPSFLKSVYSKTELFQCAN